MAGGWKSWEDNSLQPRYGRPPQHPGSSQSAVPSWEKRYCTSVCLVPWGRICAAKASFSAYKDIIDWDDIAAYEAFQNAKARYWAHINGFPSNIPLPDPDQYIDRIDHWTVIDPNLVEDLEKQEPPPMPDERKEGSQGCGSIIFEKQPIISTGWGDADEGGTAVHHSWDKFVEEPSLSRGQDETGQHILEIGDSINNKWNSHGDWNDASGPDCTWGGGENMNSWDTEGNNSWDNKCNNSWDNKRNNSWDSGRNCSWINGAEPSWGQCFANLNNQQGGRNNRKRRGDSFDSRFSKSRMNNYRPNSVHWNESARRNVAYEKTMYGGQPRSIGQSNSRWAC